LVIALIGHFIKQTLVSFEMRVCFMRIKEDNIIDTQEL